MAETSQINNKLKPALYLVPTPIGNLGDITMRAVNVLAEADIIACEDTRHTGNLLKVLSIGYKHLESYHDYNEIEKSLSLVNAIMNGKIVALVSDAGSPCISDPGFRIVAKAIEAGVEIIALPGPTAFVPALSASGMPVHEFKFFGFPPQKKGRKSFLKRVSEETSTSILYESSHKIMTLVDELIEICGNDRKACIAREISKIHEEYIRGTLAECKAILQKKEKQKGEFVVVLQGATL